LKKISQTLIQTLKNKQTFFKACSRGRTSSCKTSGFKLKWNN
jgi:hypothetical protein